MPTYDGTIIHSRSDEEGVIDVVDEATIRTLYFGTRARQSTMFLRDPNALALAYTKCVMTSLVFMSASTTRRCGNWRALILHTFE